MYIRKDMKRYLDSLASGESVPGGGSAAALAGALAMALTSMVANFTITNKKYRKRHSKITKGSK